MRTLSEDMFEIYEHVRAGNLIRPREWHEIPQHEQEGWEQVAAHVELLLDEERDVPYDSVR